MQALINYLAAESSVIFQAPVIFATALVLMAAVVWAVLKWNYASRIEALDGRIKLRDDQISDYKQKLSGATPDEAKHRIDALELQIASLAPRRLTAEQRQRMLGIISTNRFLISVVRDMGANESRKLAQDFIETFIAAGWSIQDPQVMGIGNPPRTGNAIRVVDPNNLRPAERIVRQALTAANIPFDVQPGLRVTPPMPAPPPGFPTYDVPPDPDVELLITTSLD